jgi:hypothetical protein
MPLAKVDEAVVEPTERRSAEIPPVNVDVPFPVIESRPARLPVKVLPELMLGMMVGLLSVTFEIWSILFVSEICR